MNLTFTEEQQMMRDMVRGFAKTEIEPFIPRMEAGEFPREILKKMGATWFDGYYGSRKIRRFRHGFRFVYYRNPRIIEG